VQTRRASAPTIAILLLLTAPICQAGREDVASFVERIERRYGSIEDFSADFLQVNYSAALDRKERETGTIRMKRPGRLRFEYLLPERKLFVALGEETYFYIPADDQVLVTSRQRFREMGVGGLLLDGAPSFRNRFEITMPASSEAFPTPADQFLLKFTPRKRQTYSYALVAFGRGDVVAHRIRIVEPTGNRTDYLFDKSRINEGIDSDLFEFSPPAGVEIVRP